MSVLKKRKSVIIDGKTYCYSKVVMLPTEKESDIGLYNGKLYNSSSGSKTDDWINHNIHFLSNEEIKVGYTGKAVATVKDDTRIHYLVDVLVTEKGQCYCSGDKKFSFEYYSIRAVIATTDNNLIVIDKISNGKESGRLIETLLPQPSESFVEKFVEKYNFNEQITGALVQYYDYIEEDEDWDDNIGAIPHDIHICKLKIDPKNNTITTKPVKNSWNKEEHKMDLIYCVSSVAAQLGLTPTSIEMKKFNDATHEWIEENIF